MILSSLIGLSFDFRDSFFFYVYISACDLYLFYNYYVMKKKKLNTEYYNMTWYTIL